MNNLDIRDETLLSYSSGWIQPNSEEIRCLLNHIGMTGSQVGSYVGVSPRTVRKWVGNQSPIPFAAWALLIYKAFGITIWVDN